MGYLSILRDRRRERLYKDDDDGVAKPNGVPSALILTVLSETSIKADWTIGSTNHDGHKVYISTDNVTFTLAATVAGATATSTLTGLTPNTVYYLYVVVYKGSIESTPTATEQIATVVLLYDTYSVDVAAGNVNGTYSDSGDLRTVVDTTGKVSISGGKLIMTKLSTWGDPYIRYVKNYCSYYGTALEIKLQQYGAGRFHFGFGNITNAIGLEITSSYVQFPPSSNLPITQYVDYTFLLITTLGRILIYIKGGTEYPNYTFHSVIGINPYNLTPNVGIDNKAWVGINSICKKTFSGWDEFGKNYVIKNSAPYVITAPTESGYIQFTYVAQPNDIFNFSFRQSDSTHRFILRVDEAANTYAIIKDDGGESYITSPTALTITPYTAYGVGVLLRGSYIVVYFGSVTKTFTDTFNQNAKIVEATGFTTGFDLVAIPGVLSDSDFIETCGKKKEVNIWGYGDSKTAVTVGWVEILRTAINASLVPSKVAQSGLSTSVAKTRIDADLAAAVGVPDYVCWQVGVNDISTEAQYKSDLGYCMDAIHVKFPNAKIYLSDWWSRGNDAKADLMALWRRDVIAARSWCYVGPDERIYLKGSDNGYSTTLDGVHPNGYGQRLAAKAWATALGL